MQHPSKTKADQPVSTDRGCCLRCTRATAERLLRFVPASIVFMSPYRFAVVGIQRNDDFAMRPLRFRLLLVSLRKRSQKRRVDQALLDQHSRHSLPQLSLPTLRGRVIYIDRTGAKTEIAAGTGKVRPVIGANDRRTQKQNGHRHAVPDGCWFVHY